MARFVLIAAMPRRIWRPLRSFLILICVGGAVLAADNSWMTSLPLDEFRVDDWYASLIGSETRQANVASPAEPAKMPDVESSISRWTDRSLFYRPSNGWILDAARSAGMPLSKTESPAAPMPFAQSISGTYSTTPSSSDLVHSSSAASLLVPSTPSATDGTWTSNASGNWGTAANWQSNVIADGAGATVRFDVTNISSDVTVNLDTSRTIRNLYIGDTNGTNHYTISPVAGTTLTFNRGANFGAAPILQQISTSAGDTIAADIIVPTSNNLDINNLSPTHQFVITGNISSVNIGGASPTLFFNNHDVTSNAAGDILVSGNITNGNTGATMSVVLVNGGTVTLTGTNTYTGFTEVEAGTLLINGNNSAANGGTFVDNTGTLGGIGTVGGNTNVFGGTVTGATTTTVGTLSFAGNLSFGGEGPGGTYVANLNGALSDLLAITNNLTIFSGTGLQIVGAADNIHTYVIATFASRSGFNGGEFDPSLVTGIPGGYTLVYNATDIELVPTAIPEPATWIGAALALSPLAFASGRKLRRSKSRPNDR